MRFGQDAFPPLGQVFIAETLIWRRPLRLYDQLLTSALEIP